MPEANTELRIVELDHQAIKTNLKEFLRSQSEFTDYDFEGSSMQILLDLLARNTHYMGMYLHQVASEAFLDSAQMRESLISHAKKVQYTPKSKTSAEATISIKVTPNPLTGEDNTATTLVLPKYTPFRSEAINGVNYSFVNTEAYSTTRANGVFEFNNVTLKEGQPLTNIFLVGQNDRRFVIPSMNCDTETISVLVQASASNTDLTPYTKASDLTTIGANSTVYWVEEDILGNSHYVLQFGDNYIGKKPANGSIVSVTYLSTKGDVANKANSFVLAGDISGYSDNVIITPIVAAHSGSSRESNETIRYRAPRHYVTQNRAVTTNDYETLLQRDYPNIESISVWGGEENDPPVYGKVFISIKPVENYEITLSEKERIKEKIIRTRSVTSTTPVIVDPIYTYLLLRVAVSYNPSKTTQSEAELREQIRNTIQNYRETDMKQFKSVFRTSKLSRLIDQTNKAFTSSSIRLFLQKRIPLNIDQTNTYSTEFLTGLKRTEYPLQPFSKPSVTVYDITGIERKVFFEVAPLSYTGINSINVIDPGANYLSEPTVLITGDGTGATARAYVVNGKLDRIEVLTSGINYNRAIVSIIGGSGSGATATAVLSGKIGTIRSYYYSETGEKIIVNSNAGEINFSTGMVKFSEMLPLEVSESDDYPSNILTFNVQPEEDTIYPIKNQILDIDTNDSSSIQISLIREE